MVLIEEGFFSKAWNRITSLMSSLVSHRMAEMWGLWVGLIVDAYASYREYKHAEEQLRSFFAPEIAAKLGKEPEKVTIKDLHTATKDNPAIEEAVKRNKRNRNLNFGVSALSLTASVFATAKILLLAEKTLLGLHLAAATVSLTPLAAGIATLIPAMAIGLGIFLLVQKPLEIFGKKLFGLTEPRLHAVEKNPSLQRKLSLPSQIRYLARLQHRKMPISQEQVMTAFIAADSELAAHITSSYGRPFARLSDAVRIQAIKDLGPNHKLESITEDLNTHRMRAQELAFAVHGQESGVPSTPVPHSPAPQAIVDDSAPSYTFRTRINEERQKSRQQSPAVT